MARALRFIIVPKVVHPWFDEVHKGAGAQAEILSHEPVGEGLVNYMPPSSCHILERNATPEEAAQTRPSGIAVDPIDAVSHMPAINRIGEQGVPVVLFDSPSPEGSITSVGNNFARQRVIAAAILALGAVYAPSSLATSFVISDGETVTIPQYLSDNETGVIQAGGSLETSADLDTAITMSGANISVDNSGSVSTTGNIAHGIYSFGDKATITNSGSLSTSGGYDSITFLGAEGVYSLGDNATITNSGSISTTGGYGYGIYSLGDNAMIANSGSLSTTGYGASGIVSLGADATITNSGSISTTAEGASGIVSVGDYATITNSGSISTMGLLAYGIVSLGDYATITNSGSLGTTGTASAGIYSLLGDYATITNSGSISTTGDYADGIVSSGADATITNSGSISTTGYGAVGIGSDGADATITNSGSISTTGDYADGIVSSGADATITNSGSISTTGLGAYGIRSDGDNATIANSGSISTTGDGAAGIYSVGDNATITNSGSISTSGGFGSSNFLGAYGIRSDGDNVTITNSGSISTTGDFASAIRSIGADATVTNSGSISTMGFSAYGIGSLGDNVTITNSGSISTTGNNGYGIDSNGTNATITNSGSVSTTGRVGVGIASWGDNATITNSGSLSTTGWHAFGIVADGADAAISNSGSLSTTGEGAFGIVSDGADATITNSGSISTSGAYDSINVLGAGGVYSRGANATITNSGSVITTGDYAHGIATWGANTTITNSGSVSTTGEGALGIYLSGEGSILNNSGLIQVTGSGSVAISGSPSAFVTNQTVNILAGSRVLGAIDLGAGTGDVANIYGTGGSAVMTFANTETINVYAPNAPKVGNVVVTVEPTGESSRGAVLDGLASSIHNILSLRMQATQPFKPVKVAALQLSPGMVYQQRSPYAWGQVFGSKTTRDADGQMLAQDVRLGGLVGGYEQDYRDGRVGFMVGAARTSADTDTLKQDMDSLFAGIYGHAFLGWANLSASLIAGGESIDQDRIVLDNLLGYQTAQSSTNSLFISPSLTLSRAYTLNPSDELRPSATVSYSLGRYDGYTETGTTNANLKVGARTVQAVSARVQAEWVHAVETGEVSLRLGAQARHTDGSAIKMNLSSDSIRFDAMGDQNAAGAYAGAGANLYLNKQARLVADMEYGRMTGGEKQISGQVTLQYPF
jgi:hypothetical protein